MTKKIKILFILLALIIIYSYVITIQNLPDNIIIFQGENIAVNQFMGFKINDETVETSSTSSKTLNDVGKTTVKVSLFDKIFVKDMEVDVLPRTKVIPVGSVAGVKLYTSGVLVVGMSEIEGTDNKKYKPYENTGIEEGDTILKINNDMVNSTDDLIQKVNMSKGNEIKVQYIHDNQSKECSIKPVAVKNEYKIGLWVRDSAAGVGTVTFYEPATQKFGALGHGITDIDTGELIDIASGEFVSANILNIKKGENGNPGKIQGTIEEQDTIGNIDKNTQFGIYGKMKNISNLNIDKSKEMEVALRDEIKLGKATILCSLDNRKAEEYEIEIKKIYKENNYNNKSMEIKITDEKLIEKTGGIIQGMSGSPIIQNGKFIGAVTHVLVNSSTEGYAIFGDLMIKQSKEIN